MPHGRIGPVLDCVPNTFSLTSSCRLVNVRASCGDFLVEIGAELLEHLQDRDVAGLHRMVHTRWHHLLVLNFSLELCQGLGQALRIPVGDCSQRSLKLAERPCFTLPPESHIDVTLAAESQVVTTRNEDGVTFLQHAARSLFCAFSGRRLPRPELRGLLAGWKECPPRAAVHLCDPEREIAVGLMEANARPRPAYADDWRGVHVRQKWPWDLVGACQGVHERIEAVLYHGLLRYLARDEIADCH
mmetsp:Transcript_44818/g.114139  ORF Transcript_44818/g.114139 Transcript_44818/m.114139 type:complete len:244 (+) Transcript_44818:659-1390(+)